MNKEESTIDRFKAFLDLALNADRDVLRGLCADFFHENESLKERINHLESQSEIYGMMAKTDQEMIDELLELLGRYRDKYGYLES